LVLDAGGALSEMPPCTHPLNAVTKYCESGRGVHVGAAWRPTAGAPAAGHRRSCPAAPPSCLVLTAGVGALHALISSACLISQRWPPCPYYTEALVNGHHAHQPLHTLLDAACCTARQHSSCDAPTAPLQKQKLAGLKDILEALCFLHKRLKTIHGDIKPPQVPPYLPTPYLSASAPTCHLNAALLQPLVSTVRLHTSCAGAASLRQDPFAGSNFWKQTPGCSAKYWKRVSVWQLGKGSTLGRRSAATRCSTAASCHARKTHLPAYLYCKFLV
jgi:hypothetical protein